MNLHEWTAAAVEPGDGPPEADEWHAVDPAAPDAFAGEHAVAYRTEFADPREGDERALLTLRGLYAHARVWLNGEFVGRHDTYFTPFRTVFDPEAENELLVECRAPEDRFGGVFETALVSERERVPGIRWGASVEGVPAAVITDLTVRTAETDEEVGVNAIVTIDAGSDLDGRVRLSLQPEGADGASALTQVGVQASAGERVVVQGQLSVRDPDRWWPRGTGPQNRYTVRAQLGGHDRTATTGFRTIEYGPEGLSINGTHVPVRGLVSLPDESATDVIDRAIAANATLVRPYSHVPPESFYEAADAAGVLVCQDVPMSAGALDAERARLVARTLAGAVGHRPSLAVFGVRDDAHGFDVTTEEEDRRVLRSTGNGDGGAATATAAKTSLPDDAIVLSMPGLDIGTDADDGIKESWVLDGYASDGTRTRYVVPGADGGATRARRAIEALRLSAKPFVTAFDPSGEGTDAVEAAFEPLAAMLDDTAAEPRAVVVNDTPETISGEVDWRAGSESGSLPVTVGPFSQAVAGELDASIDSEQIALTLVTDDRRVENGGER
ncbi:glycoside hydrolase family 2 sugar binding protein [Halococcus morrhuae DSM 1307]|uniref:Glycoside hydrolase family 2 sugar binding protein n=1 Tax=Halococcus morrhuae DSM 1307 TaxID=931277 RepID=M0MII8_HALMO|nr:glycoside hydrolase family 2 [Halococcus morrhuae]EMA44534.1 glycoside hydrolase family 2 sugar binding protein [Halococcus morrhuae DSM 1307]